MSPSFARSSSCPSTRVRPLPLPIRHTGRVAVLGRIALGLAALVLLVAALPDRASAGPSRRADVYEYRTSVACDVDPTAAHGLPYANYATDLTIFNPGNRPAMIWMTVALGQRIGETEAGPVSTPFGISVGPGNAFEIGCRDIAARVGNPSDQILSGFIVLESDASLDVEVAHTTTLVNSSQGISIDVRPVAERRIASRGPAQPSSGPIAICHGSGPGPGPAIGLTLYLDTSAAREHVLHGDRIGSCRNIQP